MQKRILFLGGSYFQLSPILYAKQQGHYVITCDYLPDNPGHRYSDEYHNVSTTDQEAVLQLARRLSINGIIAYASDPSAPTAAYVANRLNLPGNAYQSTLLLTRKDRFREFLGQNRFNVPLWASTSSLTETQDYFKSINRPVMVKPVDSSGSKGVSRVTDAKELPTAYEHALSFSRIGKVIIEEYIERKGYQIAGDGFVLDGRLVFRCFAQEHFNRSRNLFVPVGESFPLQLPQATHDKIHKEIQRLLSLLEMQVGAFNFDIVLNQKEEVYLLEIGPRSGGNLISEVIKYSTGIDIAKFAVDAALNLDYSQLAPYPVAMCCSCYMLHTQENGFLNGIEFDPSIRTNIIEKILFVKKGTFVQSFESANHALGCLILKFDSPEEMLEKMESMTERVRVKVTKEPALSA